MVPSWQVSPTIWKDRGCTRLACKMVHEPVSFPDQVIFNVLSPDIHSDLETLISQKHGEDPREPHEPPDASE